MKAEVEQIGGAGRAGCTEIAGTSGTGREGVDERLFRLGLRISF
jgi:hypothetical protein